MSRPLPIFLDVHSREIVYSDLEESLHLEDAYFIPIIGSNSKKFDGHIYIAGATNSGKSYLIQQIVLNDKKNRVPILFTDLDDKDDTFDKMKFDKFSSTGKNNWEWVAKNIKDRIMIFDDVQFNKEILKFQDEMLEKARHHNSMVICVNHRLQDHHRTKVALNDCSYIVTFPCSNKGNVFRYLEYELALDKNKNREILDIACKEGRHLIVHKFMPQLIATTSSVFKL